MLDLARNRNNARASEVQKLVKYIIQILLKVEFAIII
jgi:hypothetical protein